MNIGGVIEDTPVCLKPGCLKSGCLKKDRLDREKGKPSGQGRNRASLYDRNGRGYAFPPQQVGITLGEFFPALCAVGASHALADQKQVSPCDRLVIPLRFPLRGGESLQRIRKAFQRFERRVSAQILKCQPDVVGVMETVSGRRARLELCDQLFAVICAWQLASRQIGA